MPYARTRKRSFKSTRRRKSVKRRKTYRKAYLSRRKSTYRKRLPQYVQRAYKGTFNSLGNKFIRGTKIAITRHMDPEIRTMQLTDQKSTGKVIMALSGYSCNSACFAYPFTVTIQNPLHSAATNWNNFATRYQRSRVLSTHLSCEFFIQDESDQQYLNSDFFLCGIYVARDPIFPSMTGLYGDWEDLKKFGNVKTVKYVKNVSGWLKVNADINVPGCIRANEKGDLSSLVLPADKFYTPTGDILPDNCRDMYPAESLYAYPFVVPLTRAQSSGAGNINIQFRMTTRKRVIFDRPITQFQKLASVPMYPPVVSALPTEWDPFPLDPNDPSPNELKELQDRLGTLENRMDQDDIEDSNDVSALNDNIEEVEQKLQSHEDLQFPNVH